MSYDRRMTTLLKRLATPAVRTTLVLAMACAVVHWPIEKAFAQSEGNGNAGGNGNGNAGGNGNGNAGGNSGNAGSNGNAGGNSGNAGSNGNAGGNSGNAGSNGNAGGNSGNAGSNGNAGGNSGNAGSNGNAGGNSGNAGSNGNAGGNSGNAGSNGNAGGNSGNAGSNGNAGGNSGNAGSNGSAGGNSVGASTGSNAGGLGLGAPETPGSRGNGKETSPGRNGIVDFFGELFGGPRRPGDQVRRGAAINQDDPATSGTGQQATQVDRAAPARGRDPGRGDQDIAREAVTRGQAVPFDKVMATVRTAVPGDILDVKVSRNPSGSMTYTVTVLAKDGWYRDVIVDARRNRVLDVR